MEALNDPKPDPSLPLTEKVSGGLLLPGALQAAPESCLSPQDFDSKLVSRITQQDVPQHSCHWQLQLWPGSVVPCREKARSLRPRRSYFAPSRCSPRLMRLYVVEAPGTAPGSDRFITTSVYLHSQQAGTYQYRAIRLQLKVPARFTPNDYLGRVPACTSWRAVAARPYPIEPACFWALRRAWEPSAPHRETGEQSAG
jgi:hypothetical protein